MSEDKQLSALQRAFRRDVSALVKPGMTTTQLREHVLKVCASNGYDPIQGMIDLANLTEYAIQRKICPPAAEPATDEEQAMMELDLTEYPADPRFLFTIHKEIARFVTPAVRSLDITAGGEGPTRGRGGRNVGGINIALMQFTVDAPPEPGTSPPDQEPAEPEPKPVQATSKKRRAVRPRKSEKNLFGIMNKKK